MQKSATTQSSGEWFEGELTILAGMTVRLGCADGPNLVLPEYESREGRNCWVSF